jgi:hypothetical protein
MPWRRILRWLTWSLLVGPAAGTVLAIVLVQIANPMELDRLAGTVLFALVYWGAGGVALALVISPLVFVVYTAWALACRLLPALDRAIFLIAPLLAVLPCTWLGFWLEQADARDVGRTFSQASAAGLSAWLVATVTVGILVPRWLVSGLRPGAFGETS